MSANSSMIDEAMSAEQAESQVDSASPPPVLRREALMPRSSSALQQEMPVTGSSWVVEHVCKVCSVSFMSKSALSRHRQTHPVELKLIHACSECGWRFRQLGQLKEHSINVHKAKKRSNGKDKTEILAGSSAERKPGPRQTCRASKYDNSDGSSRPCQQCGKSACECNSCTDQHACRQCGKVFLLNVFLVKHIHIHKSI